MTDLITWLRAQLDEDERVALAAKSNTGRWRWDHGFGAMCNDKECPYGVLMDVAEPDDVFAGTVVMEVHGYDVTEAWQGADHIARHDPARVLREVAAKRAILDEHDAAFERRQHHRDDLASAGALLTMVRVVKTLAAPYSDREGYREEWTP